MRSIFYARRDSRAKARRHPHTVESLESRLLLAIQYSDYGQSRSHVIAVVNGGHSFEVNGIAANRTTQWWVNGSYLGSGEDDLSGFLAIDPSYDRLLHLGTVTRIQARVLNNHVFEESHTWEVRVPYVDWSGVRSVEAGDRALARMTAPPPGDAVATIYEGDNDLSTEPVVENLTFAGTSADTRYAEWTAIWDHGRDVAPLQSYYLYYQPGGVSGPYIVVTDETPTSAFGLTYPVNDEPVTTSSVTFQWTRSDDSPYGSGFKSYTLQVDNNPDFSSPLINQAGLIGTGRTVNISPQGTYHWRVIAYDRQDNSRISTNVGRFRRMSPQVTALSWRDRPGGATITGIHVGQTAHVRAEAVGLAGQTRTFAIWAVDQTDPEAATRVATVDVTFDGSGVGTVPWVAVAPPGNNENYAYRLQTTASPIVESDWLDVVGTPRVARVYLDGTNWAPAFRERLEAETAGSVAYGRAVEAGALQLSAAPWVNVDRLSLQFTEDVAVNEGDLAVRSSLPGLAYAFRPGTFAYDPDTRTATWTLDKPLANFSTANRRTGDAVRLELDAGALGGVRAAIADGRPLDGEWADGADAYPSGDGAAGGNFRMLLNVVPGDANRSGAVSPTDFGLVRSATGRSTSDPGAEPRNYTVFKDVNASGSVSPTDLGVVRGNSGAALPATPAPAPPAVAPAPVLAKSINEELFGSHPVL